MSFPFMSHLLIYMFLVNRNTLPSCSLSFWMWASAWVRTPEKEKSQLGTLFWAALKANLLGSPPFASISMAAPPERIWHSGRDLRFKHLATWKITIGNSCLMVWDGTYSNFKLTEKSVSLPWSYHNCIINWSDIKNYV